MIQNIGAYEIFFREIVIKIRNEQPNLPFKRRMSYIKTIWKKMSEKEKEIYREQKREQRQYLIDMNSIDSYICG